MPVAFLLAILATVCWSINNLIDKVLVGRLQGPRSLPVLLSFTCLFALVPLTIALGMGPDLTGPGAEAAALLALSGLGQAGWIFLYLNALQRGEASVVMALILTAPLFVALLQGMVMFDLPRPGDLAACLVVLSGAGLLLHDGAGFRLRGDIAALSFAAAALLALTNFLFKQGLGEESPFFWAGVFWQSLGMVTCGAAILAGSAGARRGMAAMLAGPQRRLVGVMVANEGVLFLGTLLFNAAIAAGELFLIQMMDALQSVFVFLFATALAILVPGLGSEDLRPVTLLRKGVGIAVICGATVYVVAFRGG